MTPQKAGKALEPLAIEIYEYARKFQEKQLQITLVEWQYTDEKIKDRFFNLAKFIQQKIEKSRSPVVRT